MAVPSSFNDITEDRAIRDYVGWAWYEKSAILPPFQATSNSTRYVLRFEGVHYYAMVVGNHYMLKKIYGSFVLASYLSSLIPSSKPLPGSLEEGSITIRLIVYELICAASLCLYI